MKRTLLLIALIAGFALEVAAQRPRQAEPPIANCFETQFARPLSDLLRDVEQQFGVKLRISGNLEGKMVPYADFRIRPYSIEETLSSILGLFDMTYAQTGEKSYEITC